MSLTGAITLLAAVVLAAPPDPRPSPSPEITVDAAVAEAQDHNLALLSQRYDVPIARAAVITARLQPNPVLSLAADHLDFLGTHFDSDNAAGPPEYSARVDFNILRGNKRRKRTEVARLALTVAERELDRAFQALCRDVQDACVEVQLAAADLTVAQENVRAFTEFVSLNQVRARAGDLAEVELMRSEVAKLSSENTLLQEENRWRVARGRLQVLLGRSATDELVAVSGEMRQTGPEPDLPGLTARALATQPELLGLRTDQERAAAELRLQQAGRKMDYDLGSEYRRQDGVNGRGNSLGFFFSSPLPTHDRNQGQIERAHQEMAQVEKRLRAAEAEVRGQALSAHLKLSAARRLVRAIEEQVLSRSRKVLDTMLYSYKRGEATFLDVLEARRSLNESLHTYHDARAELARSLYTIENLISGGPTP